MDDEFDITATLQALDLTEDMVRAHELRPDHLDAAITSTSPHGPAVVASIPPRPFYRELDAKKFADSLAAALGPGVAGFAFSLRRHGHTVASRQWQAARAAGDGNVAWSTAVPMHLASTSKVITAIAMTRLLRDLGLSPDDRISGLLPRYWRQGNDVGRITFRHLLTHRTGLNISPDPTPSDFPFLKSQIAMGTPALGTANYQNCNYGLCRILIATLTGAVPTTARILTGEADTDRFWDLVSIAAYQRYVDQAVLGPAGVVGATLDHPATNALAYGFPTAGTGWDSGDLRTMSGGIAWHLSVDQMLDVLGAFRRSGAILTTAEADAMLADGFGVADPSDRQLGRIYWHSGWWGAPTPPMRIEQSAAFILPKNMELVVLANSAYGPAGIWIVNAVLSAIDAGTYISLPDAVAGLRAAVLDALQAVLGVGRRSRARLRRRRP